MATAQQEHEDEMDRAHRNAAARVDAPASAPVRSPFDLPVPTPTVRTVPDVGVDDEMDALKTCVHALHPISHDKNVLRRIYDYLQQRFPPARSTRGRDDI